VTDEITDALFGGGNATSDIYAEIEDEKPVDNKPFEQPDRPIRTAERRTSGAPVLTSIWTYVGAGLVHNGIDPAVGRVVQFEAPLAGERFDSLIANTWVDRLLQPFFKKADAAEDLGALIALPIMIGIAERKPEFAAVLRGPAEAALMSILTDLGPVMAKEKNKRRRTVRAMDLEWLPDLKPGEDPMEHLFAYFFTGGEVVPKEGEDEAA
jgi:hypothetical protein